MTLNTVPKVVDLSHYDDLYDINQVKAAGIVGIVNKATEGPHVVDRTFSIRKPVVLGAGLKYGSYHFVRPGDMSQQVAHHLETIGDPADLMIMLDWEVTNVSVPAAREFVGIMKDKIGRWPVVYSYAAMLIEMLGTKKPDPVLANCKLWVAAYNNHPVWPTQIWSVPFLWQFTGDGNGNGPHQIPGIRLPGSRGIDVDAYEGGDSHATTHTDEELIAEWAA
jgi:lysozyme